MSKQQLIVRTAQDAHWALGMVPTVCLPGDTLVRVPAIEIQNLFLGTNPPTATEVLTPTASRMFGFDGTAWEDEITGGNAISGSDVNGGIGGNGGDGGSAIRINGATVITFFGGGGAGGLGGDGAGEFGIPGNPGLPGNPGSLL